MGGRRRAESPLRQTDTAERPRGPHHGPICPRIAGTAVERRVEGVVPGGDIGVGRTAPSRPRTGRAYRYTLHQRDAKRFQLLHRKRLGRRVVSRPLHVVRILSGRDIGHRFAEGRKHRGACRQFGREERFAILHIERAARYDKPHMETLTTRQHARLGCERLSPPRALALYGRRAGGVRDRHAQLRRADILQQVAARHTRRPNLRRLCAQLGAVAARKRRRRRLGCGDGDHAVGVLPSLRRRARTGGELRRHVPPRAVDDDVGRFRYGHHALERRTAVEEPRRLASAARTAPHRPRPHLFPVAVRRHSVGGCRSARTRGGAGRICGVARPYGRGVPPCLPTANTAAMCWRCAWAFRTTAALGW